ncbi:MAG: peptidylprolyl isomerase [Thermaerobacter sp.]|nr:peptidylprolyl isomerase [Thermaerobacter sp.]
MRSKTSPLVLAGMVAVLGAVSAGCGTQAASAPKPTPLAVVNGQAITQSEWQAAVATTDILQGAKLPTTTAAKKQQVTELAQQAAVNQWALHNHIITAKTASQEASAFVSQNVASMLGGSSKIAAALKPYHVTESQVQSFLTQEMILQAAFSKATAKITSLPKGTGTAYYNAHKSQFVTPAQAEVRMILVKTQAEAQKLLGEIKAGSSFSALAKKYSLDPSKAQGGSLGWVDLGAQSGFVPAFYQEMDKLKAGQYGIAHTQFGWHVIEVQALKPSAQQSYATVKSQVQQSLLQQKKNAAFTAFVTGLMKKARVTYHD